MHFNPFFNMEQQRRYDFLIQLGQDLRRFSNHFQSYQEIGIKLCSEFSTIRSYFDQIEILCTNDSYKTLCSLFLTVDNAFTKHFSQIGEVFKPIQNFVNTDMEQLIVNQKENRKLLENYRNIEDKFASLSSNTKENARIEKEQSLMQAHSLSTLSFFDFSMKMESLELKLKSILPQVVCYFEHIIMLNF